MDTKRPKQGRGRGHQEQDPQHTNSSAREDQAMMEPMSPISLRTVEKLLKRIGMAAFSDLAIVEMLKITVEELKQPELFDVEESLRV